ncbi:MFS transporter [Solirubrobacter taibaiensis]|nr:MFS transporter [Solirubrobacter taibaiensis]
MSAPTSRRWATLAVVCLSLLVIALDATIVNTALPVLARDLDAQLSELQWVVDAYTLAFAGLLLPAGALGDRYGHRRALACGLGVFAVASALAGLASSTGELMAARALMGAGAALVMPATLGILLVTFPPGADRAKALAAWSAVSGAGVALGPAAAGYLLEHFAWNAVFLVNLPIVVSALVAGRRVIAATPCPEPRRLDVRGALLGVALLTLFTWTLIEAPNHGWTSAPTLSGLVAALACLATLVRWETTCPHALIDISVLRDRRFSAAAGAISLIFLALFGLLFVLTQLLQFVLGYSALQAGLAALPFAGVLAAASPVGALLARRHGARLVVAAGLLSMAAGLTLFSTLDASSGYGFYLLATLPVGVGMGLAMEPATESVASALSPAQAAMGAAMNNATREVGGVLGVAIVGSLTASLYTHAVRPAVAGLDAMQRTAAEGSLGGATDVAHRLGSAEGQELLTAAREAFATAAGTAVLAAAAAALIGTLVAWRWLPAASNCVSKHDQVANGHERERAARRHTAGQIARIDARQHGRDLCETAHGHEPRPVLELGAGERTLQPSP